jgi:hypothetical protein
MNFKRTRLSVLLSSTLGLLTPTGLLGQFDFKLANFDFQTHGFVSQGFAVSSGNNFLTMDSTKGSLALTDAGFNVSTDINEKLRVSAQVYLRNVGRLGGWKPLLDYATVDYRFKDWFGVRIGRVKTALGLYTKTQDADFLRTWALLPQAIYPTDLRSSTIAHDGMDIYGNINLSKAGSLAYTAYAGDLPTDKLSGSYFQYTDGGFTAVTAKKKTVGADLRWSTPIPGLTAGVSQTFGSNRGTATISGFNLTAAAGPDRSTAAYAEYMLGKLTVAGEYRLKSAFVGSSGLPTGSIHTKTGDQSFFVSAAWRLSNRIEVGAYNSRYYYAGASSGTAASTHIFDQVFAVRYDLRKFWNVKVEGHLIDGYGNTLFSPHGFYVHDNPNGLVPRTTMLVVRTGIYF